MVANWKKIKDRIEKQKDRNIILACSGGMDSQFLLDFVSNCDVHFDVFHFQHHIRDSAEESKDFMAIYDKVVSINKDNMVHLYEGLGLRDSKNQENESRNQRWNAIENMIQRLNYSKQTLVLTGHHFNDALESVFLNLMRGKSHDHLVMKETNHMGSYIKWKPFLNVLKDEIKEQVIKRNIQYHEDHTNSDCHAERNWIRNSLIPQMMDRRNIETSMYKEIMVKMRENYSLPGDIQY